MGCSPSGSCWPRLVSYNLPRSESTKPWSRASFDNLRRPDNAAASVVAAEYRHQHAVVGADILEAAEHASGDVKNIALLKSYFASGAPAPPEKAPTPTQDEEHLGGTVAMQRVATARRLASSADVEAVGYGDVHVLIWAFRNASADDGEIFLLIGARGVGIDKCCFARLQVAVAHYALLNVLCIHNHLFAKLDKDRGS